MSELPKHEKNGKQRSLRSSTLAGAGQPGLDDPRGTESQPVRGRQTSARLAGRTQVLFICSRNQWRSPTAEQVWRRHPALAVRSAGTSPNARHPVSADDLVWADVVFVMEEKHKSRLLAGYRRLLENKPIHVLDIPDAYRYMDAELVELLQQAVGALLDIE